MAVPKGSEEQTSPSLSPKSSMSSAGSTGSTSSFVNVSENNGRGTDSSDNGYVRISPEDMAEENSTPEVSSPQTQPKILAPSSGAGAEGDQSTPESVPPALKPTPTAIPEPTLEPTPSLTSKKPKQVNNTTPQDTKVHITAASALAVAGIALGIAVAIHLEMLAVGIVIGACCLVAAAAMYHYEWPSSSIENNKAENVASSISSAVHT